MFGQCYDINAVDQTPTASLSSGMECTLVVPMEHVDMGMQIALLLELC